MRAKVFKGELLADSELRVRYVRDVLEVHPAAQRFVDLLTRAGGRWKEGNEGLARRFGVSDSTMKRAVRSASGLIVKCAPRWKRVDLRKTTFHASAANEYRLRWPSRAVMLEALKGVWRKGSDTARAARKAASLLWRRAVELMGSGSYTIEGAKKRAKTEFSEAMGVRSDLPKEDPNSDRIFPSKIGGFRGLDEAEIRQKVSREAERAGHGLDFELQERTVEAVLAKLRAEGARNE